MNMTSVRRNTLNWYLRIRWWIHMEITSITDCWEIEWMYVCVYKYLYIERVYVYSIYVYIGMHIYVHIFMCMYKSVDSYMYLASLYLFLFFFFSIQTSGKWDGRKFEWFWERMKFIFLFGDKSFQRKIRVFWMM